MKCPICKKELSTEDCTIIYLTTDKISNQTKWVKTPAHESCSNNAIAQNRILMAAGHKYLGFRKDEPPNVHGGIIQVNEDGQYQVMVSDGVYEMRDFVI